MRDIIAVSRQLDAPFDFAQPRHERHADRYDRRDGEQADEVGTEEAEQRFYKSVFHYHSISSMGFGAAFV